MKKTLIKIFICLFAVFVIFIIGIKLWIRTLPKPIKLNFDTYIDRESTEICGSDLIIDGDFENTVVKYYDSELLRIGKWSFRHNHPSEFIGITKGKGRNDSKGVWMSFSNNPGFDRFSQIIAYEKLPEVILVEGWVRTDDLQGEGAELTIVFQNHEIIFGSNKYDNEGMLAHVESNFISGTNPWTKISLALRVPPVAEEILLIVSAHGEKGKAFFDDFHVYPAIDKKKN